MNLIRIAKASLSARKNSGSSSVSKPSPRGARQTTAGASSGSLLRGTHSHGRVLAAVVGVCALVQSAPAVSEICIDLGGTNTCSRPQPMPWVAHFTDRHDSQIWGGLVCGPLGGTWVGTCVGLPALTTGNIDWWSDVSINTWFDRDRASCVPPTRTGDTGWVVTTTRPRPNFPLVAGGVGDSSPLVVGGYHREEQRRVDYYGVRPLPDDGCAGTGAQWTYYHLMSKTRDVICPTGYDPRYAASTNWLEGCVRIEDGTCPVGDSVSGGGLSATTTETDFSSPGSPGFFRKNNSNGYHNPALTGSFGKASKQQVEPTWAFDGYWRHNYDHRVYALNGGTAAAVMHRDDGRVRYFRADGTPMQTWDGPRELLIATSAPEGWRYQGRNGDIEIYDSAGRLVEVEDRSGDRLQLSYEGGQLRRVENRLGRALVFEYRAEGQLEKVSFPDGEHVVYGYDGFNRLISVVYSSGGSRAYRYAPRPRSSNYTLNKLTDVVDESGNVFLRYRYESTNNSVTHSERGPDMPGGGVNRYEYYDSWGTRVIREPSGRELRIKMESKGGVYKVVEKNGPCSSCGTTSARRTYDASGRLDVETDFSGVQTDHDYDSRGLLLRKIESANRPETRRTTETDWHPEHSVPVERRVLENNGALISLERWSYNQRGQVLTSSQIDPQDGRTRTTSYSYCEVQDIADQSSECPLVGLLKSIDGPRTDVADVASYRYYTQSAPGCEAEPEACAWRRGDLKAVINAVGHRTEYLGYDGAGRPVAMMDPNGTITEMRYHARGWLAERIARGEDDASEADDLVTRIDYLPTGLVQRLTQPDGDFTAYEYDQAHRLTAVSDAAGNRIDYTLDPSGNHTAESVSDPQGELKRRLSRTFDSLNRLVQLRDAAGLAMSTHTYANDEIDTITDANGLISDQDHDPLGRLVKQISNLHGVGSDRAETGFVYDGNDRLREVVDPKGLKTRYTYDGLDDLTQLQSPDTGTTQYTYDSAGNRATQTDARGVTLSMTYDALGRLTRQAAAGAPDIVYTYDSGVNGKGRLSELSDGLTTNRWRYDHFGRVAEKDQVIRGRTYTVRYDYSAGGRLDRITYPSGKVVDYSRDANGNIERIVAGGAILLDQVRYEPFGPVAGWVWGNGETHQRTYDLDGRLTSMTVPLEAPQLHVFGYDGQYRLNSASLDEVQLDWTYDATGNRLSETRDGATSSYQYPLDSHRLQGISGAAIKSFGYNAAGAINSDNAAPLTYDHRNRLVAGYGASYVINGLGQRVEKSGAGANSPSGARVFVYDEGGQLLGEYDAVSGVALAEHVYLDYWPVGLIRAHETFQVTPDHIGAPRAVVRSGDRVVVWNWRREPFGTGGNEVETGFEYGLRFPGQYFDTESGLHYNYFRDYHPSLGRYIESDPIGLDGGISTFAYAESQPVSLVDPLGLWVKRCSRELGGRDKPATGPRNPFRHDYINVSGTILSFMPTGSLLRSPGMISNDEDQEKGCRMFCSDDKFDKYVLAAAEEIGAPTYCVGAMKGSTEYYRGMRNCQTWVDDVLDLAKEKYLREEVHCPACFL